jgi:hypothetical protein
VSPVPQSNHLGCWDNYPQVSSAPLRGSGCLPRPSVQQEGLKAVATQATFLRQFRVVRDCIHLAAACSFLWRKRFSLSASRRWSGWRSSGLRLQSRPSRPPGSLSPLSNGGAGGGSITALGRHAYPARPAHPVVLTTALASASRCPRHYEHDVEPIGSHASTLRPCFSELWTPRVGQDAAKHLVVVESWSSSRGKPSLLAAKRFGAEAPMTSTTASHVDLGRTVSPKSHPGGRWFESG